MSPENENRTPLFLEISLVLIVFLAPLFFGAVYSWVFLSLSAFLFLLVGVYPRSLAKIRNLPIFLRGGFLFVFGIIFFQGFVSSYHPYVTQLELLKWLAWAGAFLLVQLLPRPALERCLAALVAIGCLESIYGLWEVWTQHERVLWHTKQVHRTFVTGTYFNRNHLAGLLELCLGVHLGFLFRAFREKRFSAFTVWALLLIPSLTGFFQTGSRMGILSFFLALAASASFLLFLLKKSGWKMAGFLLLILLLLGMTLWVGRENLLERWEETVMDSEYWEGGRIPVWATGLRMLKDHPWLGIGLGAFEWVFPSYQPETLWLGWAHAHSDYLELAIGLGLPGFLILCFSFIGFGVLCLSKVLSSDRPSFPLFWGVVLSLSSFALHGFADFNFALPANSLIFIFLSGLCFRWVTLSAGKG